MMLGKDYMYFEMYNNYKNIKPGTYFGQIEDVFVGVNRKGEKRLNFIVQYLDNDDNKTKFVNAIYPPIEGYYRTYALSLLIPILKSNDIDINFDVEDSCLLANCRRLIGKALPFYVSSSETNKNIRFVPMSLYK